jgi:hypothetical protein
MREPSDLKAAGIPENGVPASFFERQLFVLEEAAGPKPVPARL